MWLDPTPRDVQRSRSNLCRKGIPQMPDVIVEVIETTAASNLFIGYETDDPDDLIPVAFFARVKCIDPAYPTIGLRNETIVVSVDEYELDLVGTGLEKFTGRALIHQVQIRKQDDE